MAVVLKREEKIQHTINMLESNYTKNEFIEKFKELYPKDWNKIVKNYQQHEQKTKEGKEHPMPEPKQYIINMLNVWLKKILHNKD